MALLEMLKGRRPHKKVAARRQRKTEATDDRRFDPRFGVDIWLEQRWENQVAYPRAVDLSAGGVRVENAMPYPVGTRVRLRVDLGDGAEEFLTEAEVVAQRWDAGRPGMALRFVDLPAEPHIRISSLLEMESEATVPETVSSAKRKAG